MKKNKIFSKALIAISCMGILSLAGIASSSVYADAAEIRMAKMELKQESYHNERVLAKTISEEEWDVDMGDALLPPEE